MNIASGSLTNQFRRISYPQDRVAALCLATISGVILFGLTAAWPSWTHDGMIHLHRIRALADALRAGVIFPRWFPDYTFGYGYPALNYYAPGSYYPPALLHLAGLDIVLSLRLSLTLGFALSAWWMFQLSRLYVSLWPAIVGVICFQFFPYRMIDLFVRGAFPEFTAFIWLPLIATRAVWLGRALTAVGWVVVFVLLSLAAKGSHALRRRQDSDSPTGWRYWPLAAWFAAGRSSWWPPRASLRARGM